MPGDIEAPFSDEQAYAIRDWQDCPWTHHQTCGYCASPDPLLVGNEGLLCLACEEVHTSVPSICLSLPPNPDLGDV